MGHTSNVQNQIYRLPDDVQQTANVSRLLMLIEKSESEKFKRKALDKIEIKLEDGVIAVEPVDSSESEKSVVQKYPTTISRETQKVRN